MKKDVEVFLRHIFESIGLIESYTSNITKLDFFKSQQAQDAVIRRLEIIGEAAKSVPPEYRKKYQQIPWKEIAGMRDILVHEYFGVDLDLTWRTVQEDIPALKQNLSSILGAEK